MDFSLNRDKKNTAEMLPFKFIDQNCQCNFVEGLQSSQVKRTPQDSMNEFIIQKLNWLVQV